MPEAAMVAMTATATVAVERQVCDLLQMTDYKTLRRSPDKSNLWLVFKC